MTTARNSGSSRLTGCNVAIARVSLSSCTSAFRLDKREQILVARDVCCWNARYRERGRGKCPRREARNRLFAVQEDILAKELHVVIGSNARRPVRGIHMH